MSKNPHCKKCNIEILDKDSAIKRSNYYYHVECANKVDKEKDDFKELYNYICELYDIKQLTGMMHKQIKTYRDDYDYTNKGMYLSLVYFYDMLENTLKDNVGLGIIPFVYEEAKQHFISQQKVIKSLKKLKEPLVTEKIITIKKANSNKNTSMILNLVDMNDL